MSSPFPVGPLRSCLVLLCLLALSACSRPEVFKQESFVFGTRVEVAVYGDDEALAGRAMGAVLREFDRLHRAYHAWEPSELTALNEAIAAGRQNLPVSHELATLLAGARDVSMRGDGLFEPALGRLIALWGFHSDEFKPVLPDPRAVAAILARHPRIAELEIADDRVSCSNPAVEIDLGGYAKGYALDRAAAILRAEGIANALINIGGNVMALGKKGEQPWRVGIQHPREPAPLASMALYDGEAVGTSGDYQRYFEIDGRRYSHLLDPRTGAPANATRSMTVLITPREGAGTLSDAASKPAFIAGDDWREMTRRHGIEHALRVAADGRVEVTRALNARLEYYGGVKPDAVVP